MLKKFTLTFLSCALLTCMPLVCQAEEYSQQMLNNFKELGYTASKDSGDHFDKALFNFMQNDTGRYDKLAAEPGLMFYTLDFYSGEGEDAVTTKIILVFKMENGVVKPLQKFDICDNGEISHRVNDERVILRQANKSLAKNFYKQ